VKLRRSSVTESYARRLNEITTRAAGSSDTAFLTDVFIRSLREAITAARGEWDEARETAQFREQLDLSCTAVIGFRGTDVGFSMCPEHDADIEIHTLCVAPEYQCQGIGTYITQMLVNAACARGRGVVLSVLKVNERARRLYERLGFEVASESSRHYRMRFRRITCSQPAQTQW
jgi:ribosomal protein S18 acetylase RimI-like enzyme